MYAILNHRIEVVITFQQCGSIPGVVVGFSLSFEIGNNQDTVFPTVVRVIVKRYQGFSRRRFIGPSEGKGGIGLVISTIWFSHHNHRREFEFANGIENLIGFNRFIPVEKDEGLIGDLGFLGCTM